MPDAVTFHRYEHHMCIKAADHEIGHLGQEFMIISATSRCCGTLYRGGLRRSTGPTHQVWPRTTV